MKVTRVKRQKNTTQMQMTKHVICLGRIVVVAVIVVVVVVVGDEEEEKSTSVLVH